MPITQPPPADEHTSEPVKSEIDENTALIIQEGLNKQDLQE